MWTTIPSCDWGDTGRLETGVAFQLDHAKAAAAALAQPFQVAEGRHVDAMFAQHGEQRLPLLGADHFIVDG